MYGKGISREGSLLDMAVDLGIVKKSGAWFTYEGEQLGQGRENAKSFLIDEPRDHGRDQRPGARRGRPQAGDEDAVGSTTPGFSRGRRRTHRARLRVATSEPAPSRPGSAIGQPRARLEDHQEEHHDQQQVGDADARMRDGSSAASPVSVIDGRMRNQLTTIRITQPISDSTIQVSDHLDASSDMPTMPMPSTHTSVERRQARRRCSLAIVGPVRRRAAARGRPTAVRRRRSRRGCGAGRGVW